MFLKTFLTKSTPLQLLLVFTMTFTADLHALINYIGFAQWSQRGITMVVLFWIRYKQMEATRNPHVIRAPLIVPFLFFLICSSLVSSLCIPLHWIIGLVQTVVTITSDTKSAILCIVVLLVTYIVYMLFIYEKALPSLRYYRFVAHELDCMTCFSNQLHCNSSNSQLSAASTAIFQVVLNTMPQRIKMMAGDGPDRGTVIADRDDDDDVREVTMRKESTQSASARRRGWRDRGPSQRVGDGRLSRELG